MSASTESPPSDAGVLEPDERVGTVLADRYRIDALLGEGGMGRVYGAEHVLMRKRLAVKVLHRELTTVPEVVARFEREAMAAANIEHPNVAAATDFGKLPDGAVFLVLEFVKGKNLRDEIATGPMPVERSLHIARQIAAALGAAHILDIVHRDLKPENVMLIEKGGDPDFVKVLDFGIAKVPIGENKHDRSSNPITKVGMVFGTPEYMAPEQALGQSVDGRADLYALGVILYEMIAGVRPFSSKSPVGILGQQLSKPPPTFHERAPGIVVPPAVEALTTKLLGKEVTERFQTATDVVQAIDALIGPIAARGTHRFTMQTGSPTSVVERVASIPDLEPPAVSDFELPSAPSSTGPLLSTGPVDILNADEEVSAPDWAPPSAAIVPPASTSGAFPSATVSPVDRALNEAKAFIQRAYGFMDERRAKLPPQARELLRDVPNPALLWGTVALAAGALLAMVVLVISLATRGPSGAASPAASADRVDAPTSGSGEPAKEPEVMALPEEKLKSVAELEALAEKQPKDAEVLVQLAQAYAKEDKLSDAVGTAGKALQLDPERSKDQRLAGVLEKGATHRGSADAAFALLEGPMGPAGADVVYKLATDESGRADVRTRAERTLKTKRFEQIASAPLYAAVLLRQAQSCQQRYGLLLRAKNVGDERALEYLRRFEKTTICGSDPRAECNACLAADDRLKEAIAAIEKRAKN